MENILETLEKLIREIAFDDNISINEETKLADIFVWDDLDTVDLIMSIEDIYNIEISDEEHEKFDNIGNIIEIIKNKIK